MLLPRDFSRATLVLLGVNLLPLGGVLFLGWDAAAIVILYWAENVIIGAYTVLKMIGAPVQPPETHLGKLFLVPFFCLHFGGFCAGHGVFLLILTQFGGAAVPHDTLVPPVPWPGPLVFVQLLIGVVLTLWERMPPGMAWLLLGLIISHGVSFAQNYIGRGEYLRLTAFEAMGQPYKRIFLLHVVILAGAVPVLLLDSPVPLVVVLVLLKIVLDLWLHVREHRSHPLGADATEPPVADSSARD